ncbi:MAG: RNA polymerase factor sigma-32, partial [Candidatus Adiutrix sp.]|nr:RNA polymerase factor sigma-32 [Candidatus Adiutrix sp.]
MALEPIKNEPPKARMGTVEATAAPVEAAAPAEMRGGLPVKRPSADVVRRGSHALVSKPAGAVVTAAGTASPPVARKAASPPVVRPVSPPPAAASPDPLRAYLSEIRQFKLLTREEEEKLVGEYKKNDSPEAAQRLITSNLRLVVKIAMEFQSHWLNNLLDLIQEGNVGLMQALKKFDPGRGVKFSYYASYWIKAYILKYIMDNWRMVKVGTTQAQRKLFYNLRKERDKIVREGLEPGPKLLAERLGVAEAEVEEMDMRLSAGREVSLDAPIGPDSDQTQISLLPSEGEGAESLLANTQLRALLHDKLELFRETLSPREKIILETRLLAETPVTLQEIGEEFGISRERVRQLEERLRKTM